MQYRDQLSKPDIEDLKNRVDLADSVAHMMQTEGWRVVEAHLKDQLAIYTADNACNAIDWNDYLKKAGKIAGIHLLLTDINDFILQGEEASLELDTLPKSDTHP